MFKVLPIYISNVTILFKKYNNQENIQFKMLVYLQQYKILVKIIQMALTVNKHFRMYQHTIY